MEGNLYIIHSKQFGENVYKVGYTDNLHKRINDPCYNTCFYEPCEYKNVYKYIISRDSSIEKPIEVEQYVHAKLRKTKTIKWLKNENNSCMEMYKVHITTLNKHIVQFYTSFWTFNQLILPNFVKNILVRIFFVCEHDCI